MSKLNFKNEGDEHNFWQNYTDLMSGFLVVFIITSLVAWYGCIKCHHWSIDWKYHDSSVCNPCGIRFLTIYHRKIIEYLIRGRLAKIKS